MRPRSLALRLLPPLVGWCAVAATALPAASPLRTLPVVAFLLAGPGAAVVRVCAPALHRFGAPAHDDFGRDSDRLEQLVLTLFLSVSAAIVGAAALLAAGAFSGLRLLVLLAAATTLAACCPQLTGRAPAARASSPPAKDATT
ncbi:hypothetical protein ABZ070_20760 [Streptomyces sp. NPDC006283]|uniref:hypothetical protein n=1 Tax=Streptomyces sp. NPDC006283 TaxID=3156741 RepID=UPI0033A893B6